ncbi:MAG TPA: CRISPR-associated protein Cas4 [Nitrolancea sp.]|nr:CRISPR-associated protein Cas4 [Nitrolancea sp.]
MAGLENDWDIELVPISALEHYSYCPRQCGLIHLEQTFADNTHTTRGQIAHQRVHELGHETRPDVRREFGLPLWSRHLGLVGRADVVEISASGVYPVEHKIGKRRQWGHEAIQLCAQALCLEEMLGQPVPRGAIYYRGSQARREVEFDAELRSLVVAATEGVRAMLRTARLPAAVNDRRCRQCSLNDACLPGATGRERREQAWRAALYRIELPGEEDA